MELKFLTVRSSFNDDVRINLSRIDYYHAYDGWTIIFFKDGSKLPIDMTVDQMDYVMRKAGATFIAISEAPKK